MPTSAPTYFVNCTLCTPIDPHMPGGIMAQPQMHQEHHNMPSYAQQQEEQTGQTSFTSPVKEGGSEETRADEEEKEEEEKGDGGMEVDQKMEEKQEV